MQLTVQGKQIDVGDALRAYVTEKIGDINSKYFNHATFANVTFSREGHGHGVINVNIHIRVGKDIEVMAGSQAGDPYGAFDDASEKVAKQLRRYKRRLRDHHDRQEQDIETGIIKAMAYTLAAGAEEDDEAQMAEGDAPVIVAEVSTNIQTMSVSDAVMRMDLAGQTAFLFRNAKHHGLNMVYRRPDGNIGWIDPEEGKESVARRA